MFKISDEDIMSFVKKSLEKEVEERGLLKEDMQASELVGAKTASQVEEDCEPLEFPMPDNKLLFRKLRSGDLVSASYSELFKHIPGGQDLTAKLEALNKFTEKIKNANSLMEVFSYTTALQALRTLRLSEAGGSQAGGGGAGYALERFMAYLLDGTRLGGNRTIIDFTVASEQGRTDEFSQTPYTIKFVSKGRFHGGSPKYLISALDRYGYMNFVVVKKSFKNLIIYLRLFQIEDSQSWSTMSAEEKLETLFNEGLLTANWDKVSFFPKESEIIGQVYLPSDRELVESLEGLSIGLLTDARNIFKSLGTIRCFAENLFLSNNLEILPELKQKAAEFDSHIIELAKKMSS
jgi:hypothetical protein